MNALWVIPWFVLGAERKIPREEVPAAVIDAATARFPKAKLTRFIEETSAGKKTYELRLDLEGKLSDLVVSADGKPLALETVIAAADLPEPVRKALAASKYAKGKLRRVERIEDLKTSGPPTYELDVEMPGKNRELTFNTRGALVKDEESDEED